MSTVAATHAMCLTKKRYPDKRTAQTALNARMLGRSRQRHGRPTYLRIYPCPLCHGWHLTKKEK